MYKVSTSFLLQSYKKETNITYFVYFATLPHYHIYKDIYDIIFYKSIEQKRERQVGLCWLSSWVLANRAFFRRIYIYKYRYHIEGAVFTTIWSSMYKVQSVGNRNAEKEKTDSLLL